jgi:hypothetical protein
MVRRSDSEGGAALHRADCVDAPSAHKLVDHLTHISQPWLSVSEG